jgi:hypothetical protein
VRNHCFFFFGVFQILVRNGLTVKILALIFFFPALCNVSSFKDGHGDASSGDGDCRLPIVLVRRNEGVGFATGKFVSFPLKTSSGPRRPGTVKERRDHVRVSEKLRQVEKN